MAEVQSPDLLIYPIYWGVGKIQVTQVPWPRMKIQFVEYVFRSVFVCLMHNTAISKSSYFVALRLRPLRSYQPVCYSMP